VKDTPGEAFQVLQPFHPLLRRWFLERYRVPTDVQRRAWPVVAAGGNLLAVAPTGSGKTLCAFLWSVHQLLSGAWENGATRVLYVSPLKALNNDVRRNLLGPLEELRLLFERERCPVPEIRVLTRSGDTPEPERRQMLRRPPEILITTPESLNLLLSSPRAREILTGVRTVILDEIHAVAASKRGTHLMTAVERLALLSGEFQRIALSATVTPLQRIAEFVGGYRLNREGGEARYTPRPVEVVHSPGSRPLELSVRFPPARSAPVPSGESAILGSGGWEDPFWEPFVAECLERIGINRSTLIFTNTRRHAEKVARLINERSGQPLAYAHHGSLSREIRTVVEQKLKDGELAAIVATSSLELGIDVGELDEVLLLQTPFSVASALQRIGRAGHGVGRVSRGRIYATHGRDLLNAAVMAVLVRAQSIEELRPVENPLDVLAQVILSMTGIQPWDIDELFETLRASAPYHHLSRGMFDRVLDMLAGRYEESRVRELKPRVLLDRSRNRVSGRAGALPLIYRGGGTIPDRGYYELRVRGTGARIGELDEEFVWERKEGDTFNLGTQNWRITRIEANSVEVAPWRGPVSITPFWRAEKGARDFAFCEAVGGFLERADARLEDPDLEGWIGRELELDGEAGASLAGFLRRQKRATGKALPHRHHLLIEHVGGPLARAGFRRVVLHTLWGARVNQPLALAISAAWKLRHGRAAPAQAPPPEIFADDDCLMILLPGEEAPGDPAFDVRRILSLVAPAGSGAAPRIEELLRLPLEASGFFGARFRENAGRALLLPRSDFSRRVPLWLTRIRSKGLLSAVRGYPEFPILLETWRSCLRDDFDLDTLKRLLGELGRGEIGVSEAHTAGPSPFAENIGWIQTNQHMYEGDALSQGGASSVSGGLIREVLYTPHLRPRIQPGLVRELERKLQRTAEGYSPLDGDELWDWVRERLFVPLGEWYGLLQAMQRDHGLDPGILRKDLRQRLRYCRLPGGTSRGVCAADILPRLLRVLGESSGEDSTELSAILGEWLRYYGPLDPDVPAQVFGISASRLARTLEVLVEGGLAVYDELTVDARRPELCDAENLEILLRLTRSASRPGLQARPLEELPLFLALRQGVRIRDPEADPPAGPHRTGAGLDSPDQEPVKVLADCLERLLGYPAPAELWEAEILPARLHAYSGRWLDALLGQTGLLWFGGGRKRIAFCLASDLDLFQEPRDPEGGNPRDSLRGLLPSLRGRYTMWDLAEHGGMSSADVTRELWRLVWQGLLSGEGFEVVRRGLRGDFRVEGPGRDRSGAPRAPGGRAAGRGRGGSFDRWRLSRPLETRWFALEAPEAGDLLEQEELNRERARQLLQRYGVLFRELLQKELPHLRWPRLFRTLRLMELSGELLSGYFFESIPGVQFLAPDALPLLQGSPGPGSPGAGIFWLNAADPASPCGLGLQLEGLPPRLASNHLVFHGTRLALVSTRRGRALDFRVPPDAPHLSDYLEFLKVLTRREWMPLNSVRVETINGVAARESPYKPALISFGFLEGYQGLLLRAGI